MGFSRRHIELAFNSLDPCADLSTKLDAVVSWLIEHGNQNLDLSDDETDVLKCDNNYQTRSDFTSSYEYTNYVFDNIRVGSCVRCWTPYEDLQEGDIGKVVGFAHDSQSVVALVEWQRIGRRYQMKYLQLELIFPPAQYEHSTFSQCSFEQPFAM
ncbi:probable E3 ubiquitin-protein ligase HERC2 [Uloborus diversus]|uniref:probable E3 ubiquitin-protein ligase HERC2 n=1 Tax=Uloborus diversus TaxID=327109 RepID=UPI00240A544C|nr:probable E3 ubiquitin-protein ligase HERC2 [Uloborus diversus]